MASPRPGLEVVLAHRWRDISDVVTANMELRERESEIVSGRAAGVDGPLIVAGDFNLPEQSAIYRRYWSRFNDSHESAGWGFGTTWHTRRFAALRIDHLNERRMALPAERSWTQRWFGPSACHRGTGTSRQ
jgi:endonuclease/exonuclease/phosphatase (EEP) superfamily protein YafD